MAAEPDKSAHIRSFVRRSGRMTAAQRRALDEIWPDYGIDYSMTLLDLAAVFGRQAPRVLEIGFGNGDALIDQASRNPDQDYLGIDVHEPGVGHCLLRARELGLQNLRLICHDATEVLGNQLEDASLAGINLFFPDPWPKKRHHKRRLVQPVFIALIAARLEPGGLFHTATDWPNYAEQIVATCDENAFLQRVLPPFPRRVRTRFEARGEARGHPIQESVWRRISQVPKDT